MIQPIGDCSNPALVEPAKHPVADTSPIMNGMAASFGPFYPNACKKIHRIRLPRRHVVVVKCNPGTELGLGAERDGFVGAGLPILAGAWVSIWHDN